jgi:2-phosphosulfolactate phosphatase
MIHCGAKEVYITDSIDVARDLKIMGYLLAGERRTLKIEGFDFGNSPVEFLNNCVSLRNKSLVLTTTNGTKAMKEANKVGNILALSMLNFSAVINFLKRKNYQNIGLICSGSNGMVSLEDAYLSGLFVDEFINQNEDYELNDGARAALQISKYSLSVIKNSDHAKKLKELGLREDLEFCFNKDLFDVVPYAKQDSNSFVNSSLEMF